MSSVGELAAFEEQCRADRRACFLTRKKGLAPESVSKIARGASLGDKMPSGGERWPDWFSTALHEKTELAMAAARDGCGPPSETPTSAKLAAEIKRGLSAWWVFQAAADKPFAAQHRRFAPFVHDEFGSCLDKRRLELLCNFDGTGSYFRLLYESDKYAAEWQKLLHAARRRSRAPVSPAPSPSEAGRGLRQEDPIDREIEAFDRMKPRLLLEYEGKYVAVLEGEVRDADSDKRELARRVYGRLGMVPILIRQVLREESEPRPLPFPERG